MLRLIYDAQGYPSLAYVARDFAERRPNPPNRDQLASLLIRSIFEDGGLGRVLSIDEVTPGTPANGWTIRFTGETNGRTADPYIAIYDGQAISYNDDPSRQPRDLNEGLALALEFAAKKGGKNCNKGKPCGGSCIAKGRNCLKDKKDLSKNQQQAADALAKSGQPWSAQNPWHGERKDVFAEMGKLNNEITEWYNKENRIKSGPGQRMVGGADFDALLNAEVRREYYSVLSEGKSPAEAFTAAKEAGRLTVSNWNKRGSQGRVTAGYRAENQRWEGAGDSIAENIHNRFNKFPDPPQSTSPPKIAPEPTKITPNPAQQSRLDAARQSLNTQPEKPARKRQAKPKQEQPKQPEAPKQKLSEKRRAELTQRLASAESDYERELKKFKDLYARSREMFNAPPWGKVKAQHDKALRLKNKVDNLKQQLT